MKRNLLTIGVLAAAMLAPAAANAEDINLSGFYTLELDVQGGMVGRDFTYHPHFVKVEENTYKVNGIPSKPQSGPTFMATVDQEKRQLVVERQYLYMMTEGAYIGEEVYVTFEDRANDYARVDEIRADIDENGVITFPKDILMGFQMPGLGDAGYLWHGYNLVFTPEVDVDKFVFNKSEWKPCGEATFAECVLTAMGQYDEDDWEDFSAPCKIYKHVSIEGEYLLENPYVGEMKYGGFTLADLVYRALMNNYINIYTFVEEPGYIRFNVADPDFAYMHLYTGSGVWGNFYDTTSNDFVEFYLYDEGGYQIEYNNKTPEEARQIISSSGQDVSYYDYDDKCAYFYNVWVGNSQDKTRGWSFWGENNEWGIVTQVRVKFDIDREPDEWPEDPGTDDPGTDDPGTDDPGTDDPGTDDPGTEDPEENGVDSILDSGLAAPIYYNLQGIEVKNPLPGQILLRKSGNKVEKVIFHN